MAESIGRKFHYFIITLILMFTMLLLNRCITPTLDEEWNLSIESQNARMINQIKCIPTEGRILHVDNNKMTSLLYAQHIERTRETAYYLQNIWKKKMEIMEILRLMLWELSESVTNSQYKEKLNLFYNKQRASLQSVNVSYSTVEETWNELKSHMEDNSDGKFKHKVAVIRNIFYTSPKEFKNI
jgi:hypothetical protein